MLELTVVDEVRSTVPSEPRFRLDDHGEIPRVQSDAKRVLVHSFGNHRIHLDDAEFETSDVLVGVRESRLDFGTVDKSERQDTIDRRGRKGKKLTQVRRFEDVSPSVRLSRRP